MRHALFNNTGGKVNNTFTTAILIKDSSFIIPDIITSYITPLIQRNINKEDIVAFTLEYAGMKKVSASVKKEYLDKLLPELKQLKVNFILVNDSEYFKTLTKNVKTEPYYGYALDCAIPGYTHMKVILGVNYQAIAYNPALINKLDTALDTLTACVKNKYTDPGKDVITNSSYPDTVASIHAALNDLHKYPILTCDIETFGLKFYNCGIGSISFAWNEHEGIAFGVDSYDEGNTAHTRKENQEVKQLLKQFFINYQGTLIYHNAGFDVKVLIYELWMDFLDDYKGMHAGIDILTRNFEDTKLITYLATNNTVENNLKLKTLAQEFAGNYAQEEISDITQIPLNELLRYNLTDAVSTWYVYNKYMPLMIQEQQQDIYQGMFKPSAKLLLQLELTGMPIDPKKVQQAKKDLEMIVTKHRAYLEACPIIRDFHLTQMTKKVEEDNKKLKTKVRVIEDYAHVKFNPGSDQQVQELIYEYLGYEIIDVTKSKAPATGMKTLAKLINHAKSDAHKQIFEHLIGLTKADKILTSFIPAFEQAQQLSDGTWRLYGNFNLGGTQSGRLSSSDPMK